MAQFSFFFFFVFSCPDNPREASAGKADLALSSVERQHRSAKEVDMLVSKCGHLIKSRSENSQSH
jgi:hypothetical protein